MKPKCQSPLPLHLHYNCNHFTGAAWQKSALKYCPADVPEMPLCNFKPEEYKGLSKEQMLEIRRQNCNPMTMKITYYKKPVFIHQGHMQWVWDVDGKRYLDLFAGVATVSMGHCHPKVTAAAEKQLKKLWHTTNIYVYPSIHEYCEKLASRLPDPLKVVYLTNSGSEANDLAMLMRSFYGMSVRRRCLFHNYTEINNLTVMCPDVFRGPWGGSKCRDSPVQTIRECSCAHGHCMANEQYIKQLKETFATSLPSQIAAFFAEPIQGMGGAVQYPKNYLKEAYKLVRERGGHAPLTCCVQTGFGRTGAHFWGFQGHGVLPDIVTMAKGIGNGFPMGAVVTTAEIAASFVKALHFNTFGGNAMACAVASSVLDTIKEDGMQQNTLEVGTYLIGELAKLRDKYEIIGDVRGKGLQIGVEMVKDKASRDPLPPQAMNEMFEDIKDMGVLIGKGGVYGQTFRIQPPMCITKKDVDFFVAVFDKAVHSYMERN
uniref:Alanine--glyoxylate aminotransferase 2, mitochondrial n=1 Tax=Echeneis naucrates TaxID=173247 RepID=A0A665UDM4_ECHNA